MQRSFRLRPAGSASGSWRSRIQIVRRDAVRPSQQPPRRAGGYRTWRERLLVTVCNLTPVSGLTYPGRPESATTQDPWRVLGLPWPHPVRLQVPDRAEDRRAHRGHPAPRLHRALRRQRGRAVPQATRPPGSSTTSMAPWSTFFRVLRDRPAGARPGLPAHSLRPRPVPRRRRRRTGRQRPQAGPPVLGPLHPELQQRRRPGDGPDGRSLPPRGPARRGRRPPWLPSWRRSLDGCPASGPRTPTPWT
jgi:hypothetical protein